MGLSTIVIPGLPNRPIEPHASQRAHASQPYVPRVRLAVDPVRSQPFLPHRHHRRRSASPAADAARAFLLDHLPKYLPAQVPPADENRMPKPTDKHECTKCGGMFATWKTERAPLRK